MVVLHYKKTDLNQFLYETNTSIKIEQLLNEVCESKYAPMGILVHHISSPYPAKLVRGTLT